jgi:uncharacterized Zn finger protein
VLVQTGWLVDTDPLVLLALRGLERDTLLAELHARTAGGASSGPAGAAVTTSADLADDVELLVEAALRAQRLVPLFDAGAELPEGLL